MASSIQTLRRRILPQLQLGAEPIATIRIYEFFFWHPDDVRKQRRN
jgi:hypothetical protein